MEATHVHRLNGDPGDCWACPLAREHHLATGEVMVCECGRRHPAAVRALVPVVDAPAVEALANCDDLVHHRVTLPGPPPDRRVQVVHDPRPGDTGRYHALTPAADDAVERTARLLEELHVDQQRPAVTPSATGPAGAESVDWSRERVQTSPQWGAASLSMPRALGETVDDTIAARTPGLPEEAETLRWLRHRSGVSAAELREGIDALGQRVGSRAMLADLHRACGYQLADPKARARFDAVPEALRLGAPVAGRRRIEAAMTAWWS